MCAYCGETDDAEHTLWCSAFYLYAPNLAHDQSLQYSYVQGEIISETILRAY